MFHHTPSPKTHTINVEKLTAEFQLVNGNTVKREFVGKASWNSNGRRVDSVSASDVFNVFLKNSNATGVVNIEPNVYVPFSYLHRIATLIEENNVTVTEQ